jgi:hypothetical protein
VEPSRWGNLDANKIQALARGMVTAIGLEGRAAYKVARRTVTGSTPQVRYSLQHDAGSPSCVAAEIETCFNMPGYVQRKPDMCIVVLPSCQCALMSVVQPGCEPLCAVASVPHWQQRQCALRVDVVQCTRNVEANEPCLL